MHKSDKYAAEGNAAGVNAMHMISFLSYDIVMSLVIAICFYCGSDAVQSFLAIIPAFIIRGISVAAGILPALGFAMLGKILISPRLLRISCWASCWLHTSMFPCWALHCWA